MKHGLFEISSITRVIRSVLEKTQPGELISYETISNASGGDVRREHRSYLLSARNWLIGDGIVFECVRGEGLRRVDGEGIARIGDTGLRSMSRRARRDMRKMLSAAAVVEQTPEQKTRTYARVAMLGVIAEVSKTRHTERIEGEVVKCGNTEMSFAKTLAMFSNGKA